MGTIEEKPFKCQNFKPIKTLPEYLASLINLEIKTAVTIFIFKKCLTHLLKEKKKKKKH